MLCRMREVTEGEAYGCVYICRVNRNFGVVVVVKECRQMVLSVCLLEGLARVMHYPVGSVKMHS